MKNLVKGFMFHLNVFSIALFLCIDCNIMLYMMIFTILAAFTYVNYKIYKSNPDEFKKYSGLKFIKNLEE